MNTIQIQGNTVVFTNGGKETRVEIPGLPKFAVKPLALAMGI